MPFDIGNVILYFQQLLFTRIDHTMKIAQYTLERDSEWEGTLNGSSPQLVFVFGNRKHFESDAVFERTKTQFPDSHIMISSTSGGILDTRVYDDRLIATAVELEKSVLKTARTNIGNEENSYAAGKSLGGQIDKAGLKWLFVLSDGHLVNGSELVKGLNDEFNGDVPITGGLAGDDADFEKTLVGLDGPPSEGEIIAAAFYGDDLKVGHGSYGGWDPFGPERYITRSEGNILYSLDDQSALQLYKNYLGDLAHELPSSALLFPLSIKIGDQDTAVVRTILDIDEDKQAMVFAGDMPEGAKARLMKANFDRLVDGSIAAASSSMLPFKTDNPQLAILISCVGRRLVLGQRVAEELEESRNIIGSKATITGFYSYGEISPLVSSNSCELHNQTMTITTLAE